MKRTNIRHKDICDMKTYRIESKKRKRSVFRYLVEAMGIEPMSAVFRPQSRLHA